MRQKKFIIILKATKYLSINCYKDITKGKLGLRIFDPHDSKSSSIRTKYCGILFDIGYFFKSKV